MRCELENTFYFDQIQIQNRANDVPKEQRALVLQGGDALGAYEAGVLKALYEKISEKDKKEGRVPFDIVAGTSIGVNFAPPFWGIK